MTEVKKFSNVLKKAGAKKGEVLADDAVYDLETFQSKYEKLFNLAKLG